MSDFRCVVHGGIAEAGERVLIAVVEQCSGPGIPIFACEPCVIAERIVPALGPGDQPAAVMLDRPAGGIRRAP